MSAVAPGAVAPPRERLISPVLVTMLAFCAIGLAHLVQANGGITLALGVSGIAGWVVWAIYGSIAVLIVLFAQRFAHRPAAGVLLALAWGGLAATWAAELANGGLSDIFIRLTGSDPHAWLSTPVVEESVKALGVIGLAMIPILRRFRALDGLFYGVLIGAGFQVVEDGVFTLTALFNDPLNPMADILGNVVLRGFTIGVFTHAVYTGLVGAGIGWAASAPAGRRGKRVLGAVIAFVLVMVAHGVFNTQDHISAVNFAASFGPFIVLLLVIHLARKDELAHLAAEASADDGWGVLTADEIASLNGPRPAAKPDRKLRDKARAFAWAADHLGTQATRARKNAAELASARSRTA